MKTFEDKKTVEIHIRPNSTRMSRLGSGSDSDILYNKEKVGAAYARGGDVLRGLNKEEEKLYLSRIIGISTTDVNWESAVHDYWSNIGVVIPAPNKEGKGGGLKLEVGFSYPSEKAAEQGRAEASSEAERFTKWLEGTAKVAEGSIRRFQESFTIRQKVGEPINVSDYIFYRFCLVRTNIALDVKLIDNSAKIRFYLHDGGVSVKAEHDKMLSKRKATVLFANMIDDRDRIKAILAVMTKEVQQVCMERGYDINMKNATEEDLILDAIITLYPNAFVTIAEDANLMVKAMIEKCINAGILRRMPHSDVIYFGDNTLLGNSIDEVVVFLAQEKNAEVKRQINARIKDSKTNLVTE